MAEREKYGLFMSWGGFYENEGFIRGIINHQ